MSVVITNPSIIIGNGPQGRGSGALIQEVFKNSKFYTEGITGYVGVGDVVTAMMMLMKSDVQNERFILNSENLSFKDVLGMIAFELGKKKPSIRISSFILEIAWRLGFVASKLFNHKPHITKSTARSAVMKKCFSGEKITQAVNFEYTPIKDAISEACEMFLSRQ